MQPEQQPTPDYNFIMSSEAPKKGLFSGGTKKSRILMVVAGGIILLLVIIMVFSALFSGGTDNTEKLVSIAAQQTEIIRIAEIGEKDATSLNTRNYASAVKLSMSSAQNQLISLLSSEHHKLDSKELAAAKDTKTDQALTTAKQTNKFDETFTDTIQKDLQAYQRDVRAVFNASSGKERTSLQNLYNQTRLLATDTEE